LILQQQYIVNTYELDLMQARRQESISDHREAQTQYMEKARQSLSKALPSKIKMFARCLFLKLPPESYKTDRNRAQQEHKGQAI